LFAQLINIAIYFRAFLAILSRFWEKLMFPLMDALAMFGGMLTIANVWGQQTIYREGGHYPFIFYYYIMPSYIVLWLLSIYFSGGYDKPVRIKKTMLGLSVGTILILVLYALLPESLRFSRAMILLGTVWGMLVLPFIRLVFYWMKLPWVQLGERQNKRFLVIGDMEEATRVSELMKSSFIKPEFIGKVSPEENLKQENKFIGSLPQVIDIINIYNIDEIVFCSKNVPHQTIIDKMAEWRHADVNFKIAPEDSLSIIGSNSIHTRGDLYTVDIKAVDQPVNRRNKRLLDVVVSLVLLPLMPVFLLLQKKPMGFVGNIFLVLFGRKTWVGYHTGDHSDQHLPAIKRGVLNPVMAMNTRKQDAEVASTLNILYARDYNVWKDLNIIFFAFREMGN
jgi:hypothetical protein